VGNFKHATRNEWVELSEAHSISYLWDRILVRDTERKRKEEVQNERKGKEI
jgi:hypothetical protein